MTAVLRYAGFGNETVFGTPVAATFYVDQAAASLDSPSDTEMYYEGGLGRGVRKRRAGFYLPQGNVVYATDMDTICNMLRWALGTYVFTAGVPNTHEAYGIEDPEGLPFFTTRLGKDGFEHFFTSCMINQLQLEVADQFVVCTADVISQKDGKTSIATLAAVTALLPANDPLTYVHAALEIPAASDISTKVKAFTVTINNNFATDSGRSIGSRFARRGRAGDREVMMTADLHYEDEDELVRFWGGANAPAVGGATDFATLLTLTEGTESIEFDFQSMHHTQVQLQPTGRSEMTQTVASKAVIADHTLKDLSTVETEVLATVLNDYATVA